MGSNLFPWISHTPFFPLRSPFILARSSSFIRSASSGEHPTLCKNFPPVRLARRDIKRDTNNTTTKHSEKQTVRNRIRNRCPCWHGCG
jgi:hypothetical protein